MLLLSDEVFVTFAFLTLQVDLFYLNFTEEKLRHGAEYISPSGGQRCLVDFLNLQMKAPSCCDRVSVHKVRLSDELKNSAGNITSVQGAKAVIPFKQYE